MSRALWRSARALGSLLTLGILLWRLGTGPFLDGLRTVDGGALAAAAGITVLTTVCCAWRWKTVAAALGVGVTLPAAVAAYYRSQFLNLTLPGGVLGDIHRGVSHGREVSDVGRALRAVALERFAGQLVQVLLTVVVLLVLPSPVRSTMPLVAGGILAAVLAVVLAARTRSRGAGSAWSRLRSAATGDGSKRLLTRRSWLAIGLASSLVIAGHALTFLLAARTVGTRAAPSELLPIALLAMMAMVLPSAGGWGPREGVTAWAFGAAGLGASSGVATGVVYGLMALVASLPGAVVIALPWFRRARLPGRRRPPLRERAAHA